MKKFLNIFIISFFIFLIPTFIFAQTQLEINYPQFFNITPPQKVNTDVMQYFRYIYYTILAISGFIALGALFYGGFRYLTSAGNAVATQDAKDQIYAALLGMIILFGSGLFLYTVNPKLIVPETPTLIPTITPLSSGIWLCKESKSIEFRVVWERQKEFRVKQEDLKRATTKSDKERIVNELIGIANIINRQMGSINEKCYLANSGNIASDFAKSGNFVKYVYSVPEIAIDPNTQNPIVKTTYAAFLFQKENFEGTVQPSVNGSNAIRELSPSSPVEDTVNNNPKSVLTIAINQNWQSDWKVTTCEEVADNLGRCPERAKKQEITFNYVYVFSQLDPSPKSINFSHENNYIAILSKELYLSDPKFITSSESNLLQYPQITDEISFYEDNWRTYSVPAAKYIFLISGRIY